MAQQASPKLSVHSDDFLAMAKSCSVVVVITPGTRPSVAWLSRLGPGRLPEPRTISVARGGMANGEVGSSDGRPPVSLDGFTSANPEPPYANRR